MVVVFLGEKPIEDITTVGFLELLWKREIIIYVCQSSSMSI